MDVRLSPEQQALRDATAQLVDRLAPRAVGDLDDDGRAARLDAAIAGSEWRELRTASDQGQPYASAVEAAIVAEELARGLADTPFVGPTLAADLRRQAGAPTATAPETVLFAPDLGAPASTTAGAVAVDAAGATSALLVDSGRLGSVALAGSLVGVDLTRPAALPDDAVRVTPVGGQPLSAEHLTRWTALALALTSADLVGVMRGAITLAGEHVTARHQYGVPVGSFQAVQHLLADAFVAMEGSRSVAMHAAWSVDALDASDALAATALAKAYCARSALAACETVIQVHGGIGNTWECLAHVYLRRALFSSELSGGVGDNLARVLEHHGIGANDGLR
jgi:alkylation response protein AidB-like acyl-CoA dehydrogenase